MYAPKHLQDDLHRMFTQNDMWTPGIGAFHRRKAHQRFANDWGARRRFHLSLAEREDFIICQVCAGQGRKLHKRCPECEGSGYENI